MLRCNGRDAPILGRPRKTSDPASSTLVCPIALSRVAPCFRTPLLGRVDRSSWAGFRNLTIVKVSSRAYRSASSSLSQRCRAIRLRSGQGYGRHRLPASLRRSTAAASAVNQDGCEPPEPTFHFPARRHGVTERNQDIGGSERLPAGRERTSNVRQLQAIGDGCKRDVATANTAARQLEASTRAIFVRHLRNPPPRHT